jgi:hypothetical protein
MNSIVIRLIVFVCVFGAALLGLFLRRVLPQEHLSADSKDTVRLGMGMIATMAALVLGLLVASAKSFYDAQGNALTQMSAHVIALDRLLSYYGAETKEVRDLLRGAVVAQLHLIWHQDNQNLLRTNPTAGGAEILNGIQALSPKNDAQRTLQAQALSMAFTIGNERWLMLEEQTNSISLPLLAMAVVCERSVHPCPKRHLSPEFLVWHFKSIFSTLRSSLAGCPAPFSGV